ncbi:D-glycero-beta-D-manno-heptose 1,7-bisphosphate 7-phosphatase [Marinobacter caseinilyticus]|uniref:D-glycero-beta-D-manno-heptose 1,7-bisphosphate 7-phosphatase n=1 Tax=Marinobacter caseinilyticus TaxID=2692195 RepID=UPI0014089289|nr:D-glycero-beta-D-manno-heptose 1,7-bisphosphate 7-phosphatase [Marinobacter caseinilyticus]
MLIILDRDGVINAYDGHYICSVDEWHPLPGSIDAIARLCQAGHRVAIATNQSGIARGLYDVPDLDAMHQRLNALVSAIGGRIDFIAYCPHHPDDGCDCRKPKPGLLYAIQQALALPSLAGSLMVGDSRKDLEAGLAGGCNVALVRTGNGRDTETHLLKRPLAGVRVFDDLAALVDDLIA